MEFEKILPADIEKRSFELLSKELKNKNLPAENEAVIKRVIHTTADFDYEDNLYFSPQAVAIGLKALRQGASIVTDTKPASIKKRWLVLAEMFFALCPMRM